MNYREPLDYSTRVELIAAFKRLFCEGEISETTLREKLRSMLGMTATEIDSEVDGFKGGK